MNTENFDFKKNAQPFFDFVEGESKKRGVVVLSFEEKDDGIMVQAAVSGSGGIIVKGIATVIDKQPEVGELFRKGTVISSIKNIIKI